MGNCQASDAVAVLIEYPNGRLDRLYWAVAAREVMLQNAGYYVGVYVWPKSSSSATRPRKKPKLKILPPSAMLIPGHCYRLVSFEEAVDSFSSNRGAKLSKLRGEDVGFFTSPSTNSGQKGRVPEEDKDEEDSVLESLVMSQKRSLRHWTPSLQSISETGGRV